MIPKETIEKIKEIADIVEVIGDFVDLKKSGQSYKGLSPFVQEKTPSFMVSPAKGIFKDFSSGKGGDSISFVMEHEGLSYLEAIKWLAQRYGIEIQETEPTPEQLANRNERESLFIVLNFAKDQYKDLLFNHPDGQAIGMSYFRERGFNDTTLETFELGYSLDEWDYLKKKAEKGQYSVDLLEKSGLIIQKEGGKIYDRFRGRVIFPIHNLGGKVIGFGARILTNDKKQPKYINSPETEIYHKSDVLYGLYQAKNEIRNKENCYLVEGYTDVLSLHQAEIKNVVASSGTALTTGQIKLIKRFSQNVTVLYDGDAAGIRASMRGIDLILEEGLDVSAVEIPEGEDPDSYLKKIGGAAFREFLETKKTDFITFKTKLFLEETKGDPIKKANIIKDIVETISKVQDNIKRAVFFQQCSRLLDIDESVLISEYNKTILKNRKKQQADGYSEADQVNVDRVHSYEVPQEEAVDLAAASLRDMENEILRILINFCDEEVGEDKFGDAMLREIDDVEFQEPVNQRIISHLRTGKEQGFIPGIDFFMSQEDEELKKKIVDLVTNRYEISEKWEDHAIYVKHESDDLTELAVKSILRLKWRVVKKMAKDIIEELGKETDLTKADELQRKYLRLKEVEMSIAKNLGNVASG